MSGAEFDVSIGEAARAWGVSVETSGRWANQGIAPSIRTPGGQRRFRRADVERLLRDGLPESDDAEVNVAASTPSPSPAVVPPRVQPWEAKRQTAAARLDATRSEIERREEIRRFRQERERQHQAERVAEVTRIQAERATATAKAEAARAAADLARVRQRQQEALDQALRAIRGQLTWAPASERSEVERFLAEHAIIGESIPWIEAEVAAIRERHRAAEKSAADRERRGARQDPGRTTGASVGRAAGDLRSDSARRPAPSGGRVCPAGDRRP